MSFQPAHRPAFSFAQHGEIDKRENDGLLTGVLDPEGAHLAALRRLADFAATRVVEIGCGDGRLTRGIAEHAATVLAFDPDADAVAAAAASLSDELAQRVRYRVGAATEIDVPRSEFDIAVFSWSL